MLVRAHALHRTRAVFVPNAAVLFRARCLRHALRPKDTNDIPTRCEAPLQLLTANSNHQQEAEERQLSLIHI